MSTSTTTKFFNYSLQTTGGFSIANHVIKHDESKTVLKSIPTNHIIWIDCSGSMSSSLSHIRNHLKNTLPRLVKDMDTISLGWFSSRSEYGVLQEEIEVKNLKDLNSLNEAIDRFLRPVGLTGFKEPLTATKEIIECISKNRKDTAYNFFFLTDGHDNQWSVKEILTACEELKELVSSATIVEYGYYCNRDLLSEMASILGGSLIFSESFNNYIPLIENSLSKEILSNKKLQVYLNYKPEFKFAYTLNSNNEIVTYEIEGEAENEKYYNYEDKEFYINVNEDIKNIYYITRETTKNSLELVTHNTTNGNREGSSLLIDNLFSIMPAYIAVYLLSQRGKSDYVNVLLDNIGDVNLFKKFANAFGKQNLSEAQQLCLDIIQDKVYAFADGYDTNLFPDDNQFCVLDLVNLLGSDNENKFYPSKFEYRAIGAKKIDKNLLLTEDEQALTKKMSETTNSKELVDLQEQLKELRKDKHVLKFTNNDKLNGFPFTSLVWNEDRPNLSIRVKYLGVVNIPDNNFGIPNILPTFIYNTYTLIKDGIVNLKQLHVTLSLNTFKHLQDQGLLNDKLEYFHTENYVLDINEIPVINKKIAKEVSAIETFKSAYELLKQKAYHKVFNNKIKTLFPKVSQGYIDLYGIEGEQWLKSLGITESGGFSPSRITSETNETYDAIKLIIKIAGETLPTLKALEEKMKTVSQKIIEADNELIILKETLKVSKESNNLTDEIEAELNKEIKKFEAKIKKLNKLENDESELNLGESFMAESINKYNNFIDSNLYKDSQDKDNFLETWLKLEDNSTIKNSRDYITQQAKVKFALVLNQSWFSEFSSISENTMTLKIDNKDVKFTANLEDFKVAI